MAIKFIDGYTHYASADPTKYTSGSPSVYSGTPRRPGVKSGSSNSVVYIGNLVTATIGTAFRGQFTGSQDIILFTYDSGPTNAQCKLHLNSADGSVSVMRGSSTVLATSAPGLVQAGTWYYAEMAITCDNVNGSFEVRLDGVTILSGSEMDTRQSDTGLLWGASVWYAQQYSTDYYVNDGGFLGDCIIDTLMPMAAGSHGDWTPSSGTRLECIDDPGDIDEDATYNSSNTAGASDTFSMDALPTRSGFNVLAVALNITARNDGSGASRIAPVVRIGGIDYVGSPISTIGTYKTYQVLYELNPATAGPWTKADLDGAEFGYAVVD